MRVEMIFKKLIKERTEGSQSSSSQTTYFFTFHIKIQYGHAKKHEVGSWWKKNEWEGWGRGGGAIDKLAVS